MSTGSDINVTIISGALDSVPRIVPTKNDSRALSFSLAVNRTVNTDNGLKTFTSWYNIASFNNAVVEIVEKLNKGDKVIIQGALSVRNWIDQASGQKRLRYEVVADRVSVVQAGNISGGSDDALSNAGSEDSDMPDEIFN